MNPYFQMIQYPLLIHSTRTLQNYESCKYQTIFFRTKICYKTIDERLSQSRAKSIMYLHENLVQIDNKSECSNFLENVYHKIEYTISGSSKTYLVDIL